MEVSYRERPSKKTSIASNMGISRAGEEEETKEKTGRRIEILKTGE